MLCHKNDVASVAGLRGPHKFRHFHVGDDRRALEMTEDHDAHEVPHVGVVFGDLMTHRARAVVLRSDLVDLIKK